MCSDKTGKLENLLDVTSIVEPMKALHISGVNRTLSWRLSQLSTLLELVTKHKHDICNALYYDLHKESTECQYSEISIVINEICQWKTNLKSWMKLRKVGSPGILAPLFSEVRSMPLASPGCLIISPFNYPIFLSLVPVVGALGGGNPVVLKPSELTPSVSSLLAKLVLQFFDKGVFQVVEGGKEVTTELLKHTWGLCFFTGSARVGKVILRATAETMTPTVLELGGKCPLYIAEDCPKDISVVCNRIIGSKLLNSGQTCIAPDYVLCHYSMTEKIISGCKQSILRMFGNNVESSELARMVSISHAQRQLDLIKEIEEVDNNMIVIGGSKFCDVQKKIIVPTVILDPLISSRVMNEEIFGPILPVITVKTHDEAIAIINNRPGTPLALYTFTSSRACHEKIINSCPASTGLRNDALIHIAVQDLPFGGLGTSGMGKYIGKASFDTFTHSFSNAYHPCIDPPFSIRYHPHGKGLKSCILTFFVNHLPVIPPLFHRMILSTILIGLVGIVMTFFLPYVSV